MGYTTIEKILSKASKQNKVNIGDRVWAELSLTTMRDFGGPNAILEYIKHFDDQPINSPSKTAITFDLQVPAKLEKNANNQKICRDFAKQQKIEKLYDVHEGIGNHVLFEKGLVHPGDVIIGTDSHMNLLGAFGAFATGGGHTDITAALKSGKLWYRVPPTLQFILTGKPKNFVTSKDVILSIIKEMTTSGALYKSIEFTGDYIDKLELHDSITLASMVTEMSGKIGFIPQNQKIKEFFKSRNIKFSTKFEPDSDAEYEEKFTFNINDIEPSIACPHSPDNVKNVSDVEGEYLDQIFIGSCTNGRYEDMEAAAKVLKGKKVHKNIRLIVVPATKEVTEQCIENGLFEIFVKSGAVVCNPGCSLCTTGHHGVLADGEICLSTSNRNFPNKVGKGSSVYLSSPITAAYSAIAGKIRNPSD
ncbi:MAG: aconitase/3-isopropylmalate dehydratase large subunit family protein [Candidatus Ranarchaeia archaeon]